MKKMYEDIVDKILEGKDDSDIFKEICGAYAITIDEDEWLTKQIQKMRTEIAGISVGSTNVKGER